jgi:LysR family glycine cleavage system transcriptional activator
LPERSPLTCPRELAQFTLLHDTTYQHWGEWLKLAGATDVDYRRGLVIEDSNVMLQAAIEGEGVALGYLPLVHADLKAGRLVKPFDIELPVDLAIYAVCPEHFRKRPEVGDRLAGGGSP